MLDLATFIGGIVLGGLCGMLVNLFARRFAQFYGAQAKLALMWPSVIGGLITLSFAWRFGVSPKFWVYTAIFFVLGIAAGIDFLLYILPDFITLGGTVIAFPLAVLALGLPWQHAVAGCVVGIFALGVLYVVSLKKHGRAGLGLGDVKLMACLGALFGVQALPQIWLVAIVLTFPIMLRMRKVPFGPFLVLGAWSWVVLPWCTFFAQDFC